MITQENTVLNVFRIIGERRIPYIIELDSTMTVVVDRPDLATLQKQTVAPPPVSKPPTKVSINANQFTQAIAAQVGGLQEKIFAERAAAVEATRAETIAKVKDAVASGKVALTANAAILEHYPELADSMQGEILATETLPNGGTRITYKPTPTDIKVGEWVVADIERNPIEGTDELRAEYFAAEKAMHDKHAADGTACRPCDAGALMRKYRAKLQAAGFIQ